MRYLKWFICLCLANYICGESHAQTRRVRGNLGTDTLLIVYRDWTNTSEETERTDTIIAASDGSFSYNFPDPGAVYTAQIQTKMKTNSIRFLALPDEEAVIPKWSGYAVTGSGFYRRWGKLREELKNCNATALRYLALKNSASDAALAKSYADSSKMYVKKIHQKAWKYIKTHPDDPVSAVAMDYLKDEYKQRAYRRLSSDIKTGALAAYAARFNRKQLWATSFLNQKAPKLTVEGWITEEPDIKGKFVLIDFWATWCAPCRAAIPELNKLAKKFKKKLVVIGLSDQPAETVKKLNRPIIEYYNAVDTKAYMKNALGIRAVPHVILMDPQWIVRWEGFPALTGYELTEREIRKIMRQYKSDK